MDEIDRQARIGDPLPVERRRALVVAARESRRRPAALALADAGFCVAEAATPAEALARCHARRPDVIVLDADLGPHDGVDLCPTLRAAATSDAPPLVLLVMEADAARPLLRASLAGADGVVLRPYDGKTLARRIRHELRLSLAVPVATPA